MGAALDAKGLKRICTSCGTRFYDFKKRPIKCPNCETEFTGEIKVKTRRGRVPVEDAVIEKTAKKGPANDDDTKDDVIEAGDDTVSLDDVKAAEDADVDDEEDLLVADDDLDDIEDLEELEEDLEEDLDVDVKKGKDD